MGDGWVLGIPPYPPLGKSSRVCPSLVGLALVKDGTVVVVTEGLKVELAGSSPVSRLMASRSCTAGMCYAEADAGSKPVHHYTGPWDARYRPGHRTDLGSGPDGYRTPCARASLVQVWCKRKHGPLATGRSWSLQALHSMADGKGSYTEYRATPCSCPFSRMGSRVRLDTRRLVRVKKTTTGDRVIVATEAP